MEKLKKRFLLDNASRFVKMNSSIEQAIAVLENIIKGVSKSQQEILLNVIETLKNSHSSDNDINIESVLKGASDDLEVMSFLHENLMNHDTLLSLNKRNVGKKIGISHKFSYVISSSDLLDLIHGSEIEINNVLLWDFNVYSIKSENPQSYLAWKCFKSFGILEKINLSQIQLQNILLFIEQNYSMIDYNHYSGYHNSVNIVDSNSEVPNNLSSTEKGNPYHNNLHGADVFQSVLYFSMTYKEIGNDFTTLDFFSLLFAAYIHDFNHPGVNTNYVTNDWPASGISTTFGNEVILINYICLNNLFINSSNSFNNLFIFLPNFSHR